MSLSAHERHQLEEIEHALHHQHLDLDGLGLPLPKKIIEISPATG